jgi:hypothetical protein
MLLVVACVGIEMSPGIGPSLWSLLADAGPGALRLSGSSERRRLLEASEDDEGEAPEEPVYEEAFPGPASSPSDNWSILAPRDVLLWVPEAINC